MNNSFDLGETRRGILRSLLNGHLSALDLEEELGISESAIRRHLDVLEHKGFVEPYFEKAKRGRPKKRYKITSEGRRVFPQKTNLLFGSLVRNVKEKYGDEGLETLLEDVASDFAEKLISQGEEFEDSEEKLKKLVDSLDNFGFYPSFREDEDSYYIEYRNCVFGDAIESLGTRLCKMHRDIIRNVLEGSSVDQRKSFAGGDDYCLHRIKF